MQQIERKGAENGEAEEVDVSRDLREAAPTVTDAMAVGLRDGLRELLALGVPAEAVEAMLGEVLQRLHAGVKQVRSNKQLAPWMHAVLCRAVAPGLTGSTHPHLTPGHAAGQDGIAAVLAPFTATLPDELAEVLRLTDFGALTQRAAASRLGLGKVALKSKVQAARRRLRVAVEAGLALALAGREADAHPDTTDLTQDVRPPRQRLPASALIPALTAGLEQLVRPWASPEVAPTVAASVLANLRAAHAEMPHSGRIPGWLYAVSREAVLAGNTGAPISTLPNHPTVDARSILSPAMHALVADVPADPVEALTLVDLDGHSQRDAALRLGILPETLKQRLWRARRFGWESLTGALAVNRAPAADSTPAMLTDALQSLIQHLAPSISLTPVLQRLLRQLRASTPGQRPSSSLVEYLYASTREALQPQRQRCALPTPPVVPGPTERTALATCLAPFLATLTPEQSEALTLIDLDGCSLNAAAAEVGANRPSFQGRLQRARSRLRRLLGCCLLSTRSAPPNSVGWMDSGDAHLKDSR